MKRALALIAACILLPALPSHLPAGAQGQPRDEWAGTYEYTASLGRTAGGTGCGSSAAATGEPAANREDQQDEE